MARVVMPGMVVLLLSGELLGSGSLSLGVEVLNLSFTEDTVRESVSMSISCLWDRASLHVGVAGWRFVDFGVVDDEEDLER